MILTLCTGKATHLFIWNVLTLFVPVVERNVTGWEFLGKSSNQDLGILGVPAFAQLVLHLMIQKVRQMLVTWTIQGCKSMKDAHLNQLNATSSPDVNLSTCLSCLDIAHFFLTLVPILFMFINQFFPYLSKSVMKQWSSPTWTASSISCIFFFFSSIRETSIILNVQRCQHNVHIQPDPVLKWTTLSYFFSL